MATEIVLIRHGETEWSATRRHTSVTDVPLTEAGVAAAKALGAALQAWRFDVVLSSPMQRARTTAALSLPDVEPEIFDALREWDYGTYEGITTAHIHEQLDPSWNLWTDGCPGGEQPEQVAARCDLVLQRAASTTGTVACFAHGHVLRVLAARWLGLEAAAGAWFALDTATVSVLGREHDRPVLRRWNAPTG